MVPFFLFLFFFPQAVNDYMVQVAGQYEAGLPEISAGKWGFVMPRRVGGIIDLEVCTDKEIEHVFLTR